MSQKMRVPGPRTLTERLVSVDEDPWLTTRVYPHVVRLLTEKGEVNGADLLSALQQAADAATADITHRPMANLLLSAYVRNLRRYIFALAPDHEEVRKLALRILAAAEASTWE